MLPPVRSEMSRKISNRSTSEGPSFVVYKAAACWCKMTLDLYGKEERGDDRILNERSSLGLGVERVSAQFALWGRGP